MDRRGFLRLTAGGTAAIAVASVIPAGCGTAYPQAEQDGVDLQALNPKQYAVVRAAAEALLVGVPVAAAAVARNVDVQLALVGDPIRRDMRTVLTLLEHATPLSGRFRRFTTLDNRYRLTYLQSWGRSRFALRRAAHGAIKSFVYFSAYASDATRSITGFRGPWTEYVQVPAYPVDFGEIA